MNLGFIKKISRLFGRTAPKQASAEKSIYEAEESEETEEIHSLWDYLKFLENTQAFHLRAVIGFNEWADMDEIKRRIKEIFGVEYKNEKSLYPYVKTMVDIGLIESINIGGRRKWRKKELLIKLKKRKKPEEEKEKELIRA